MALTLGYKPQSIKVLLSRDSWFTAEVVNDDGMWPAGSQAELRLAGTEPVAVWPAVVDGASFRWALSPTEVNAALAAEVKSAKLFFVRDGRPELWGQGPVVQAG